jgi:hypothetical protein
MHTSVYTQRKEDQNLVAVAHTFMNNKMSTKLFSTSLF